MRRIDGQIIVNKQKWVELQLQPFLTMAMLPFELGGEMWDWEKKRNERIWKEVSRRRLRSAAPILFFIVAPITIKTDKKVARFRNSIFAKHSGSRPQLGARTPVGIWMGF